MDAADAVLTVLLLPLLHVVDRHDGLVLVVLVDGGLLLLPLLPLLGPIPTITTTTIAAITTLAIVTTAALTIALAVSASISTAFATPVVATEPESLPTYTYVRT